MRNGRAAPAQKKSYRFARAQNETRLLDGRTALVFESDLETPIRLLEQPARAHTFELRAEGKSYALPYATTALIKPEERERYPISEIYVYL